MTYKQIAYTLLLVLTSTLTQAQVKIGKNPTTITPDALLDIEGATTTTRTVSLTNGNFGIGTATPKAKLDVVGNIGFNNSLNNGQLAGYSNTLTLVGGSTGLAINNNANTATQMYITYLGTIGIGTTTPVAKLDVVGNISFNNSLNNGQLAGYSNTLTLVEGTSGLVINNNTNTISHMVVSSSGTVGIGTATPVAKLDVVGDIGFNNSRNNGRLAGYSNTLTLLEGTSGLVINNNANTKTHVYINYDGAVGIGATMPVAKLDVGGNIGFNNDLNNGQLIGYSNTLILAEGTSGLVIRNNANAVDHVYVSYLGTVGIGTTSPAAKLDILGNIRIADGTQGAGKILTSDANGIASWQSIENQFIPKVVFAGKAPAEYTVGPNSSFRIPLVNSISTPGFDAGTNEFVIQESGFYKISGGGTFIGTSDDPGGIIRIYVNTPTSSVFQEFNNIQTGTRPLLSAFWDGYYNPGDRISLVAQSTGTGSRTVRIINLNEFLTIIKLY